jgi:maleate cis-trans isomerase
MEEIKQEPQKCKKVMRIRVEADRLLVEEMATRISEFIVQQGFEVLDQSRLVTVQNDRELGRVFILVR